MCELVRVFVSMCVYACSLVLVLTLEAEKLMHAVRGGRRNNVCVCICSFERQKSVCETEIERNGREKKFCES